MLSVSTSNSVEFDVGGPGKNYNATTNPSDYSYIRYSSISEKIEIQGSFINNSSVESISFTQTAGAIDSQATFIGGGYQNGIHPTTSSLNSLGSSIVGGGFNDITGRFSFIGNGYGNKLGDNFSAIVAGYNNTMPDIVIDYNGANIIGAGSYNQVDGGSNQSILVGKYNEIEYNPGLAAIPYLQSQSVVLNPDGFIWNLLGATISSVGGNWFVGGWFCGSFYSPSFSSPTSKLYGAKNLQDSDEVGENIYTTNFLGTPTSTWVYVVPTYYSGKDRAAWFQISSLNSILGWMWTNEDIAPFAYSNTLGNWVYFDTTTANQYYDYNSLTYKTF